MGTKVQIENYLPGRCSMRDLSRESNGASWPSCYGDNNYSHGQLYYGFLPRPMADSHPGYDKDVLKLTMLEHEAIFKNQVYELHRLYQVQRNLMDEFRKKERSKRPIPYETSSSSSPLPAQIQSEDVRRWNGPSLPMANSFCGRHPIFGPDTNQSLPHSIKGKSVLAGPSSFQNCYSPKTSEVSESRPSKSRRRMLDLQLPAEEYIDTDEVEQFGGANFSDNPTPSPDKNGKFASGNGTLFLNHAGRGECHGDASRSDSHACKSNTLADLNEPLHFEEASAASSVNFLEGVASQSDIQLKDLSSKYSNPSKVVLPSKVVPQTYWHGSLNENLNNLPCESRPNGQNWFCYTLESEQHKGSVRSINKETPPVPSQLAHCLLDQTGQPPAFLTCDRNKGDPWRAKSVFDLEKPDKSYTLPSYNVFEPSLSSHVPNQRSLYVSAGLGKSCDPSVSTCGKPSGCLNQKFSIQTNQFLSKSPQSSAQSNDMCGNRWNLNSSPGAHAAFGCEPSMRNGFYQGSSSSFKELPAHFPPVGFDFVNCNYSDKSVLNSSNSFFKSATGTDMSSLKDMNLNVPLSNELSNNHISVPDLKIMADDKKSEDPLAVLPWLRGKSTCSKEAENPRKVLNSSEAGFCQDPSFASNLYHGDAKSQKNESNNCLSSRKIVGVSIFDKPCSPKKENSPVFNSSAFNHGAGKEQVESSQRKGGFDMNVPCEPSDSDLYNMVVVVVDEKKVQNESASLRNHFDLNSCITEEESPCGTTPPDNACFRGGTGIDLEVPVLLESEEEVLDKEDPSVKEPEEQPVLPPYIPDDGEAELAKLAAEVIVGISSSVNQNQSEEEATCLLQEACQEEVLHWFVDVASSCGIDPESYQVPDGKGKNGGEDKDCLPEGLDDFESMTLRLKECNVEEYFLKPSVPEFLNIEGNGTCLLTTRTRKGQARRGRQRRDFLRDILPGLVSLSRHEVTEDLQTFGGLMRATGHPWHSGPNRRNATRNGCGRGRKRSMAITPVPVTTVRAPLKQQQLPCITAEIILEDRSLTGWGKTTRRPRRQRCPASNPPPPVPLS